MIKILDASYNIPHVDVTTALTSGTKSEVGTPAEFDNLSALVGKSGLAIVSAKIGGNNMCGTCWVNFQVGGTGLEFCCCTNYLGNPMFISIYVEIEDGKCYATPSIISLGGNSNRSSKKSE